jgi:hypothetical protein
MVGDRIKRKPEKHDSLNERGGVGEEFLGEFQFFDSLCVGGFRVGV